MRARSSTVRRRRAQSATSATQKEKEANKSKSQGSKEPKKSVQWTDDLAVHNGRLRKSQSADSYIGFDQALRKLTMVSTMMERSATLERDFEENLNSIREKMKIELSSTQPKDCDSGAEISNRNPSKRCVKQVVH